MSYIGASPSSTVFLTDQFSGNGATVGFTMSTVPAGSSSLLVSVSGVLQDPSTYSVTGSTLTFSTAPPSGTGNISVRYLGIPASGVTTTAYRTITEFTATAGQTTFTPPSYTVGFIAVYRNGVRLGAADFTATNGTTIVLGAAANLNDLITTESFYVSSVLNAIPSIPGAVNNTYLLDSAVTTSKIAPAAVTADKLDSTTQYTGFKNRIINGAMAFDQRNTGNIQTNVMSGSQYWLVDRFRIGGNGSGAGRMSFQQVSDAPDGFSKSGKITVTTAQPTYAAGDLTVLSHIIEGLNINDFAWGTPSAKYATLSFWVKASVVGNYSVSVNNPTFYTTNYTINAADTWEYKTIVVPPATTGVWPITTSTGIRIDWNLGSGSTVTGAGNAWSSAATYSITGSNQLMATQNATWQITGVQFEKGAVATSFDARSYGTELALCQRYYQETMLHTLAASTSSGDAMIYFPVHMRAAPTYTYTDIAGTTSRYSDSGGNGLTYNIDASGTYVWGYRFQTALSRNAAWVQINYKFSSEL